MSKGRLSFDEWLWQRVAADYSPLRAPMPTPPKPIGVAYSPLEFGARDNR